ncbi:MAG TPA: hypothetical protein VHG51_01785, partial [Longimicrobiaceae bacterium]|nr:hypothetical protein [Longimicrobiaceae bacterium]
MAHLYRRQLSVVLAVCSLAGAAACRAAESAEAPRARMVQVVRGLGFPESVRYDPEQDVFFVSNMNGPG